MNVAATALLDLSSRADSEDGVLIRTVVNSSSASETGFALGLLADRLPARTLVSALNLREILHEIPESPFVMHVDFDTLSRISGLERSGLSWVRALGEDPQAPFIEVLGQGNLCYDLIVRAGDRTSLLKPGPRTRDFVQEKALDLLLSEPGLLSEVIALMLDMGVVHNPRFYLTVEDWQMEHAVEAFNGLTELF